MRLILMATAVAYVGLVASHRGEFWPFSVFPMFSRAGKPWVRVVLRELEPDAVVGDTTWDTVPREALPGRALGLDEGALDLGLLSRSARKAETWVAKPEAGQDFVRELGAVPEGRRVLVVRAHGRLEEGGEVVTAYEPIAVVEDSSLRLSPHLEAPRDTPRSEGAEVGE